MSEPYPFEQRVENYHRTYTSLASPILLEELARSQTLVEDKLARQQAIGQVLLERSIEQ